MSEFARQLNNLEKLESRTFDSLPLPRWWSDLLSLWRPSGVEAGAHGLRLAIRNGYLNFYRRGQSIARVEIDSDGIPTAATHFKYVCSDKDEPGGQEYVKLKSDTKGGTTIWRSGKPWREYRGPDDLEAWIAVVDNKYAGDEKEFVDLLVAANPNIIDLEMGLPAWDVDKEKRAPRIDLVAIEDSKVVFWEAKLVRDGRLRTSGDLVLGGENTKPAVLKQLNDYQEFLLADGHADLVRSAYQNAAKLMMTLRSMADKLGEVPLGAGILAAASGLEVDCNPRLIIDNRTDSKLWKKHEEKLRQAGFPMLIIGSDESFELRHPC